MDALARGSHLGYDGLSTTPSASGTCMCMHMPAHGMLMHMGTHGRRGQHAKHAHSNAEQQQLLLQQAAAALNNALALFHVRTSVLMSLTP